MGLGGNIQVGTVSANHFFSGSRRGPGFSGGVFNMKR
jgi:hypothetical protein